VFKGELDAMKQTQRRSVVLLAIGALMLMGCTPGWGRPVDPVGRGPVLGVDDGVPSLAATPELDSLVLSGLGSTGMLGYLLTRRRARRD
jgi:hypothetical protein